jgi:putative SOS response-associated peptidase YedK
VIPADGFYEWTGPKHARQPFWIHRRDGELLLFAGLYQINDYRTPTELHYPDVCSEPSTSHATQSNARHFILSDSTMIG